MELIALITISVSIAVVFIAGVNEWLVQQNSTSNKMNQFNLGE